VNGDYTHSGDNDILPDIIYILLPLIALAAFVLKGVTGFGPAIIVIAFGSLFLPPHVVIAVSAILDMAAGGILLRIDRSVKGWRFWVPLGISILVGSVIGSFFLKAVPAEPFRIALGVAIFTLGLWFLAGRTRTDGSNLMETMPDRCGVADIAVTVTGGFCGGFFGISGPPIIWHFGRTLGKKIFRQTLIRIFFVAALARVATYSTLGLVDLQIFLYALAALPGLFLGIYLGNRIFLRISESMFSRIVGAVLLAIAVKLFF